MKEPLEILEIVARTPVPSLLATGGIVLIILALVAKFGAHFELSPGRQILVGVIGVSFLICSMGLYIAPALREPQATPIAQANPSPPGRGEHATARPRRPPANGDTRAGDACADQHPCAADARADQHPRAGATARRRHHPHPPCGRDGAGLCTGRPLYDGERVWI